MHVILQFAFEIVQLDEFDLLPAMFFSQSMFSLK